MNCVERYLVQWDKASDDGLPKVVMASFGPDIDIFRYAEIMFRDSQVVMVEYLKISPHILFDTTHMADWDTIQDALDAIIKEEINVKG